MRNIKLVLRYDGTDYAGWQFQKNAVSIQEVVQKTLKNIVGERVTVTGSGRTDAGVHAEEFVANFKTRSKIACQNIKNALNGILPKDVVVSACSRVHLGFNAQYSAKKKLYRYTVSTAEVMDPLLRRAVFHYAYRLNIGSMRKAAKILAGRHDFKAFENKPERERDTVRNIYRLDIEKKRSLVYIYIEANGFLRNMVRNIAGTLLEIGRGRLPPDSVKRMLARGERKYCGFTAPAHGLCLVRVTY